MKQWIGLFVAFLTIMVGCSAQPPQTSKPGPMEPVASGQWPVLADDLDPESLGRALEQSRVYLKRLPADRLFQYGPDRYTAGHLLKSLDTFEKYFVKFSPDPEFQRLMERDFILYRSIGRDSQGEILVTGYYEPELRGAKSPSERFRWPIYGLPHDLVTVDLGEFRSEWAGQKIYGRLVGNKLFPYFSRHDIDSRWALAGRGLELVWVDDPVSLFFLHIQGSGRVSLPDGRVIRLGYAGVNGRAYRSLGQKMIDSGLLGRGGVTMQTMQAWLRDHPEQATALLEHNESYVFFRELEGDVVGNINVYLTPGRSVALDHKIFPKGVLAFLETRLPVFAGTQVSGWNRSTRFVLVQDTGGAITGPGRLDLFFGHGARAELTAGHMKEPGRLYFPVLKLR